MSIKSLIVFLDATSGMNARMAYALNLAEQHQAHLIGISVSPPLWTRTSGAIDYTRGTAAVEEMVERHSAQEAATHKTSKRAFDELLRRTGLSHEFRAIHEVEADQIARLHALHADLVIVGHSRPDGLPHASSPDAMLIKTGVPFLIVPDDWHRAAPVAQNVMIAWNASREARRAVTDTLPLLKAAKSVTVLVVDVHDNASYGEQPGADVAQYLCRHGANVSVEQRQSAGRPIATVLRQTAHDLQCDLIAIGAYSHNRLKELVFGGVTRSILSHVEVPTVIAH